MVGSDGRVRVLDFGLARAAAESDERADGGARPRRRGRPPSTSTADGTRRARRRPRRAASGRRRPAMPPLPVTTPEDQPRAASSREPSQLEPSLAASTPLTHAGTIVGTPRYMAPEQHPGDDADERADQFSFCVSLYHALYGAFPFGGDDAGRRARRRAERAGRRAAAGQRRVPRWLRQVLLRGLARAPGRSLPVDGGAAGGAARRSARRAYGRWLRAAALVADRRRGGSAGAPRVRQQLRACAGAERKLAGVWDDARRAAVRAAFRAQRQALRRGGARHRRADLRSLRPRLGDDARRRLRGDPRARRAVAGAARSAHDLPRPIA